MWRAASNTLPTTTNLWRRNVLQSPWCQRCKRAEETTFHAIFYCKNAQKIWRLTEHGEEIKQSRNKDVLSLIIEIASKKGKYDLEVIFALCWVAWHSRNLNVLSNKMKDSQISVARAEAVVQSFKKKKQTTTITINLGEESQ